MKEVFVLYNSFDNYDGWDKVMSIWSSEDLAEKEIEKLLKKCRWLKRHNFSIEKMEVNPS